jgi:hypothetical protein
VVPDKDFQFKMKMVKYLLRGNNIFFCNSHGKYYNN